MGHGIRIARLFGIDIALHPSWFIILAVLVWSLAVTVFPAAYAWSGATYWAVAVVAALLLFASVLAHELAHSLVAKRQGIPVKNITLFLLGGVSTITREPTSPGREALMAAVGPLTSLALGGIAWVAGLALQSPQTVRATLLYLGSVNVLLGLFNLLPGFPLDGGRVLRALLWSRSRDFERATSSATRVGVALGYGLALLGVVIAFRGSIVGGIWMAFIGWMLVQSSRAARLQSLARQRLAHIRLHSVMSSPRAWLSPDDGVDAANRRSREAGGCAPVGAEGRSFEGVVCQTDLRRHGHDGAGPRRVRDVMTPRERLVTLGPDDRASEALRLMMEGGLEQIAVTGDDGLLDGFVERARLLRVAELVGPQRLPKADGERTDAATANGTGDAPRRAAGSAERMGRHAGHDAASRRRAA